MGKLKESNAWGLNIPLLVWAVGFVISVLVFIIFYYKCKKQFQFSLPIRCDYIDKWLKNHKTLRTIMVRQSTCISTPLTYGIFRPVILFPKSTDWGNEKNLEHILTHEHLHITRLDAIFKLALIYAVWLHWWNPFVWVMFILANRDIELSCDESAIKLLGESKKSAYALTLVGMEEKSTKMISLHNYFGKGELEERVTAIMKIKKTTVFSVLTALILLCSFVVVFATSYENSIAHSFQLSNSENVIDAETYSLYSLTNKILDGLTFYGLVKWYENFKTEAEKLVEQKIWTQKHADFIMVQYENSIAKIEQDGGKVFGMISDGSNEVTNVFYDIEHLLFQVPDNIEAIDNSNWIFNVSPIQ